MLRLDEDFAEFHAFCKSRGGVWQNINRGVGRLLLARQPCLRDLVKVICTTNVQLGALMHMVRELVEQLASPLKPRPNIKLSPRLKPWPKSRWAGFPAEGQAGLPRGGPRCTGSRGSMPVAN